MNIKTLKIICDLIEMESFSRTAEKYGISQSAVSQQLAQIEIEHKCQLVNRKKRPLTATKAGQAFYIASKDILARYDKLNTELKGLSQSHTKINMAAIFSIGMHTLQPYVKKFMSRYPSINLRVEYRDANDIYASILSGDIDFGVVAMPKKDRNIDVYPFEREPLVLTCSPDNPLANEPLVDIHKLQGQEFIAFDKELTSRTLIDRILHQYNVSVHTVMEFDNVETLKRAIEINAGISILPQTSVHMELANGTLKAIPFTNEKFYRPTGVIIRRKKILSQAGKYLLELLHHKYEEEAW
jgi:DNA-binding transcriptional LysR family regulator